MAKFSCMGCGFVAADKRGYSTHTRKCIRFKQEAGRRTQLSTATAPAVPANNKIATEKGDDDVEESGQLGTSGSADTEMNTKPLPVRSIVL